MFSHACPPSACTMASSAARACCAFLAAASSPLCAAPPAQARWQRSGKRPCQHQCILPPPLHAKPGYSSFHPLQVVIYPTRTAPPFTFSTSPLMNPASGVHRNSTGPAISRVLRDRPSGMPALIFAPIAGSPNRRRRHLRRHPSRRHAIHPDTPRRQLARQALGETNQGAFGHGIVGVMGLAPLPGGRADQHDVTRGLAHPVAAACRASICLSIWATAACTSPNTESRFTPIVCRHWASGMRAIGTSSGGQMP